MGSDAEHIGHVVEPGRAADDKMRRTHCPQSKDLARMRAMRELDALARTSQNQRVVAHNISAPDRVHADLTRGPSADLSCSAIFHCGFGVQATRLRDDLDSCIGCGCLSLKRCRLFNPGDRAAEGGAGPRFLLHDGLDDSEGD